MSWDGITSPNSTLSPLGFSISVVGDLVTEVSEYVVALETRARSATYFTPLWQLYHRSPLISPNWVKTVDLEANRCRACHLLSRRAIRQI
jgi:hypothetical protein